jgi:hypothetical protein
MNHLFVLYLFLCVQHLAIGLFTVQHKTRMNLALSSNFGENNFGMTFSCNEYHAPIFQIMPFRKFQLCFDGH